MAFITTDYPTDPDAMGEKVQDLLCEHFLNTSRRAAKNSISQIELEWPETVDGEERWYRTIVSVIGAEDVTDELAMLEEDWRERQREYGEYDHTA